MPENEPTSEHYLASARLQLGVEHIFTMCARLVRQSFPLVSKKELEAIVEQAWYAEIVQAETGLTQQAVALAMGIRRQKVWEGVKRFKDKRLPPRSLLSAPNPVRRLLVLLEESTADRIRASKPGLTTAEMSAEWHADIEREDAPASHGNTEVRLLLNLLMATGHIEPDDGSRDPLKIPIGLIAAVVREADLHGPAGAPRDALDRCVHTWMRRYWSEEDGMPQFETGYVLREAQRLGHLRSARGRYIADENAEVGTSADKRDPRSFLEFVLDAGHIVAAVQDGTGDRDRCALRARFAVPAEPAAKRAALDTIYAALGKAVEAVEADTRTHHNVESMTLLFGAAVLSPSRPGYAHSEGT